MNPLMTGSTEIHDPRWDAVLSRDGSHDGAFVFAVTSTGIYCRPSCPSRRPKRDRVRFFSRAEEAERAGFRACRRCRPREADSRLKTVEQICEFIKSHTDELLTLAGLAARFGMTPFHLQRTFKAVLGVSPRQYADACRMDNFKAQVRTGRSVTDAIYEAGYGSSSRLYERSEAHLGMTPATYRRGGKGMFIRYTTLDSPVGRMLLAATDSGVCSITFGDSDGNLLEKLRREFPDATLRRGEAVLRRWVRALLQQLHGEHPLPQLPLDVQATAFQRRVWEHLRSIPYGSTKSYGDVARAIGDPGSARAVARACASNPVAVAIPCHRVVRSSGDLGGYRWGIERKRTLLEMEQRSRSES